MLRSRRLRWFARLLARSLVTIIVCLLILVGIALSIVETGWGKNQIRALIVRQANPYLSAHLEIGRLGGSLLRGLQLGDITLSRDGRTLVSIEQVSISYSLRELFQEGLVIKRIAVSRPTIVGTRQSDGRWDLATLVRREAREQERTGPRRPIDILAIEVRDATIALSDPVAFGAAHIPTRYEGLNASVSFHYVPVRWSLNLADVSFRGSAPTLAMNRLTGTIANGPGGMSFDALTVETPRSSFAVTGRVEQGNQPTVLNLDVHADRFAFQEWAGVLAGLKNLAVEASFETTLRGPLTRLDTNLKLTSTAGSIQGRFALNTREPGWLGAGNVNVERVDLAKWLNKPDKPSDISGRVTFDLAFGFGRHFPRGTYAFDGRRAMFMGYEGENIRARGRLTAHEALVTEATAIAYGASVKTADASIGIADPFPFHFPGTVTAIDLRDLPVSIPVPHVESTLTFDYDVTGQFSKAFVIGRARFAPSAFLGATILDGTVGTLDTSAMPLTFSGDGEIDGVDLRRFGAGLQVEWMQDPRYAGTVSGRFRADGSGTDRASLRLTGGGRLRSADVFGGRLVDADVSVDISEGSLRTSYAGRLMSIDPAIPFADDRFAASLSGSANLRMAVRDLLARSTTLSDVDVEGTVQLQSSRARGVTVDDGHVEGLLHDGVATIRRMDLTGASFEAHGTGSVPFLDDSECLPGLPRCDADFDYDIQRADLALFPDITGGAVQGLLATQGRLTGPLRRPHFVGTATVSDLKAPNMELGSTAGEYDVALASLNVRDATAHAEARVSSARLFGRSFASAWGTVALAGEHVDIDSQLIDDVGRSSTLKSAAVIGDDRRHATLETLTVTFGRVPWRLATADARPTIAWNEEGVSISSLPLVGPSSDQHITISGTSRRDGNGSLRVAATHVFLDTLTGAFETPARYGGVLDLDATIRGTPPKPIVTGNVSITDGRVRRFAYQRLTGRVGYTEGDFDIDVRLDQAPGVFITAGGTLPLSVLDRSQPERPINLAIVSSQIGLGLVEGLTDVVSNVVGQIRFDVKVIGTSADPHFEGTVDVADASFQVRATGSRYKNGRAGFKLSIDRVDLEAMHIEDNSGRPLDLSGSLGTHELRVGDLQIDAKTQHFEVIRNEFGRVDIDAKVSLRGRFEEPRVVGNVSINGGDIKVDEILERTLFRPYSTEPLPEESVDAVAALNPWNRLGLDVSLHIPPSVRLVGQNVQVTQGTPIGLGDVKLRVGGDLYLYKDAGGPLSVTGSLDDVRGTYRFQGRPFEIDEARSSINFLGDLNPEMYVSVTRVISSVETRVTISGDLRNPELQLTSTPPLDSSDIFSLIVFGTSANDLSVPQQQELAVRAGTLAAGFLATPIVSAVERSLGLEVLQIEPTGEIGAGPRVTIGEEIAPGLVARFSRQFGQDVFDEAVFEYTLSRLFRIRGTFSDAADLNVRSPFRRIERAGIDLLLFFSF